MERSRPREGSPPIDPSPATTAQRGAPPPSAADQPGEPKLEIAISVAPGGVECVLGEVPDIEVVCLAMCPTVQQAAVLHVLVDDAGLADERGAGRRDDLVVARICSGRCRRALPSLRRHLMATAGPRSAGAASAVRVARLGPGRRPSTSPSAPRPTGRTPGSGTAGGRRTRCSAGERPRRARRRCGVAAIRSRPRYPGTAAVDQEQRRVRRAARASDRCSDRETARSQPGRPSRCAGRAARAQPSEPCAAWGHDTGAIAGLGAVP